MSISGLKRSVFLLSGLISLLFISASASKQDPGIPVPLLEVVEYFDLAYDFSSTMGALRIEHEGRSMVFHMVSDEMLEVHTGDRMILVDLNEGYGTASLSVPGYIVDLVIIELMARRVRWFYENGEFSVQEVRTREGVPGGDPSSPVTTARTSNVNRRQPENEIGEIRTIIIDAGHGGKDPGGVGYANVREKDIVLPIALELKKELKRRFRGMNILLTRSEDIFLSLEERGELANGIEPTRNPIFLSIHANVSFTANTEGYETFFLSLDEVGEEARDVAARENSVLDFEIEDSSDYIQEIINRMVDIQYRRESMLLAEQIQSGLDRRIGGESINRGVKSAFFYVLKESKMPAVLIEVGFVTSREESERLLQSDYQRRIARGISDGVEEFIMAFNRTNGFTMANRSVPQK